MFYRVDKEECAKGIKPRYEIGQIIDDNEVFRLKKSFEKYRHTYYTYVNELKLEFHDLNEFNNKIFMYFIKLTKGNSKSKLSEKTKQYVNK